MLIIRFTVSYIMAILRFTVSYYLSWLVRLHISMSAPFKSRIISTYSVVIFYHFLHKVVSFKAMVMLRKIE